jgi:hypothetical protein
MSKTTFSKKCEILGTLWSFYKDTDNDTWQEFFSWADLGLPMAYLSWQKMVTIKAEHKGLIDDAWNVFCEMIEIDADASYTNLAATFDASSHDKL